MSVLNELLQQALAAHQTGNWSQAEQLYSQLLRSCPPDSPAVVTDSRPPSDRTCEADARHLFGLLRWQTGHPGDAVTLGRTRFRVVGTTQGQVATGGDQGGQQHGKQAQ